MACKTCGHTKSSPCACKDTPLETTGLGLYADCDQVVNTGRGTMTIPERCEEVVCRECVARCNNCCPEMTQKEMLAEGISGADSQEGYDGDLWQVETKGAPFKAICGERLDMTIQRLALAMNDANQIQWHIPLFYIAKKVLDPVTNWTVTLAWEGGDWSSMIGVQVYYQCITCDDNAWVLHNAPGTPYPTPATLASGNPIYYNISGLQDGYRYAFKLVVEHAGDAGTFTDPATVVQKAIMFNCE
jgi:hypothetical protein